MNTSAAVQVFLLVYVLVVAALYLTAKFWLPWLAQLKRSLGWSPPPAVVPPPVGPVGGGPSFRPGAPRPPRLKAPPALDLGDQAKLQAYARRLSLCGRIVAFVASGNPTGFPIGLFREWHAARWLRADDAPAVDSEQAIQQDLRDAPADAATFAAVVAEFAATASYAEMADLTHFCGEAFAASKAGSFVHDAVVGLADRLAVVVPFGAPVPVQAEEHERLMLERKLEVDFLPTSEAKVEHLRRMHAFFRARLIELRDQLAAERRAERMADCRRHMEEHERMLGWLGSAA